MFCILWILGTLLLTARSRAEQWTATIVADGYLLLFSGREVNWTTAKSICALENANLLKIDSGVINNAAQSKILNGGTYHDRSWIGANDRRKEGAWVWTDGSPIGSNNSRYSNWHAKDPNGLTKQNCAAVKFDGFWISLECSQNNTFVCQKEIEITPSELYAPTFSCSAELKISWVANPDAVGLKHKIIFAREGSAGEIIDVNLTVNGTKKRRVLTARNLRPYSRYNISVLPCRTYECVQKYKASKTTFVIGVPNAVTGVTISIITLSSFEVSWAPPGDINITYITGYKIISEETPLSKSSEEVDRYSINVTGSVTSYRVHPRPYRRYRVGIQAMTCAGLGSITWSDQIETPKTKELDFTPLKLDVSALSCSSNVTITWIANPNAIGMPHKISYMTEGISESHTTTQTPRDSKEEHHIKEGLKPWLTYNVSIIPCLRGDCIEKYMMSNKTIVVGLPNAVNNFTFKTITYSTLEVSWTPPTDFTNGYIIGYKITVKEKLLDTGSNEIVVNSNDVSASVTSYRLEPRLNRRYEIGIQAITCAGLGDVAWLYQIYAPPQPSNKDYNGMVVGILIGLGPGLVIALIVGVAMKIRSMNRGKIEEANQYENTHNSAFDSSNYEAYQAKDVEHEYTEYGYIDIDAAKKKSSALNHSFAEHQDYEQIHGNSTTANSANEGVFES